MPPKRKRGRPKLPRGAGKLSRLVCRLQESEEAEIEEAAKRAGMTKSEFVREAVLAAARAGESHRQKGYFTGTECDKDVAGNSTTGDR